MMNQILSPQCDSHGTQNTKNFTAQLQVSAVLENHGNVSQTGASTLLVNAEQTGKHN